MRTLFAAAVLMTAAIPAVADTTEGLILAFDRKDGVVVMADKSVWELPADMAIPADLGAGDRILIDFTSDGDNGVVSVDMITRLAVALAAENDGGS